jgi:hypothetical protein
VSRDADGTSWELDTLFMPGFNSETVFVNLERSQDKGALLRVHPRLHGEIGRRDGVANRCCSPARF